MFLYLVVAVAAVRKRLKNKILWKITMKNYGSTQKTVYMEQQYCKSRVNLAYLLEALSSILFDNKSTLPTEVFSLNMNILSPVEKSYSYYTFKSTFKSTRRWQLKAGLGFLTAVRYSTDFLTQFHHSSFPEYRTSYLKQKWLLLECVSDLALDLPDPERAQQVGVGWPR